MKNWVLLRGLGRSAIHWGDLPDLLQKKFPENKIEILDSAGNGSQYKQQSFLTIPEYTENLRTRSEFIQKGEKVNLLSISMGSMIAVDWATRYPNEVESIVLINTSDKSRSHFYERLNPIKYAQLLKVLAVRNAIDKELNILSITAAGLKNSKYWAEKFAFLPLTHVQNLIRQIIAASGFSFPIEKPQCQVKILASRNDKLVDPVCSERIALAWNTPIHTHPEAGHDLPLWDPEWVISKLEIN